MQNELQVFSINDAAFLLGMRRERLCHWLDRDPFPLFGKPRPKRLSLSQLLEIEIVTRLRDKDHLSLKTILTAHQTLRNEFNTLTPFAEKRALLSSKSVLFERDGEHYDAQTKQQVCSFIEQFVKSIRFSADGKAGEWIVWEKTARIVVKPEIRGGLPVFDGTRIDTHLIVSQVEANDYDPSIVARLYEVPEEFVLEAVAYELQQAA